jgi:hypothetical protein
MIYELARGHATPPGLSPCRPGRGCGGGLRGCGTLGVGEQVPGAGEQLAGDRGGGDFLPAPLGDGLEAGGELGDRLAVCAASHSTQRSHTEPCLEM